MALGVLVLVCLASAAPAGDAAEDPTTDERQFEEVAQRYHRLLSQRPRKGTAFDLLYRHYLDAGKLDELVAHYERLVRQKPDDAAARLVLGMIYERRGRFEQALQAYRQAAKLAPQDYYPHYAVAQLAMRLHKDQDAAAAFERALKCKPERADLVEILKNLGRVRLRLGDRESALEAWEQLADAFPNDPIALQELAELLAQEEEFEQAIRRYRQLAQLVQADPYRRLTAEVEIGELQVRQGKLETAIRTLSRCLDQVKPDSWLAKDIRRRIEAIFVRSNDRTGLVEYYRGRLKEHPDDLESRVRLAAVLAELGQDDAALQEYRAALKAAPTRTDIREKLIDELVRQGRLSAALDEARTLVEQRPRDADALARLGRLYIQAARPDAQAAQQRALDVWRRIAELRPDDPLAALRVAELCREAVGVGSATGPGRAADTKAAPWKNPLAQAAAKYYAEAVRRAPDVPQYREYYGEFLWAAGRTDQAVAVWREIAEPPRDTTDNLLRVAELLARVDQLAEAVEVVEQAARKTPDRFDVHKLAAELLARDGRYDQALKHVDEMERLADTPLLLEQCLTQRLVLLKEADRVEQEAKKLDQAVRSKAASVRDAWFAAMLAASSGRHLAALKYVERALEQKPDAPFLLRFKAELYEQGGDLAAAAEQYRRLAQLDPKLRTQYLTRVVSLEQRLGRLEAAVKAAQELWRRNPENSQAAELLANVYFSGGETEKGLDVLREALRANPRDRELRLLLARHLQECRLYDEALEQLWRAFELSDTQEDKLAVVDQLAAVYAVVGRGDELVARLQTLRRTQQDRVGTTLYLARAYTQLQDYVAARRELTGLLASRPNDVAVLEQLVALSELLDDVESALQYQQKLVALSRTERSLERLARLYQKAGDEKRAREIQLELARKASHPTRVLTAVDRALAASQYAEAIALAEPQWRKRPDDWRFGYRLACAYWFSRQLEDAVRTAQALLALPPTTRYRESYSPGYWGGPGRRSSLPNPPPELLRTERLAWTWATLHADNPGFRGSVPSRPLTLEEAQQLAALVVYAAGCEQGRQRQYVEQLRRRAASDLTALRQLVWIQVAERNDEGLVPLLKRWVAESPQAVEPRLIWFKLPFAAEPKPLTKEKAKDRLAEKRPLYEWFATHRPDLAVFLASDYVRLLAVAGEKEQAVACARQAVANARDLQQLLQLGFAVQFLDDSQLHSELLSRAEQLGSSSSLSSRAAFAAFARSLIQSAAAQLKQGKKWSDVLSVFDCYMAATHPDRIERVPRSWAPLPPIQSAASPSFGPSMPFVTSLSVPSAYVGATNFGLFLCPSTWLDDQRLQVLATTYFASRKAGQTDQLLGLLASKASGSKGVARQCWKLAEVFVQWWHGEQGPALEQLKTLADELPGNVEIRVLLARAYAASGDYRSALSTLKGVSIPFGPAARTLEKMRLELAQLVGDDEAGKQATLRLFGMQLQPSEQTKVAAALRRYGLAARSEQLLTRATLAAGKRPGELVKIMVETRKTDLQRAVEIARALLRRTSYGSGLGSPTVALYRSQALDVLAQAGQLQPLIEKTERQLAAAPQSATLMKQLIEYYTAAGEPEKARAMVDRLLATRPDRVRFVLELAQFLFHRRDYDNGIQLLGLVWKKDPEQIFRVRYEVSGYYVKAGRLDLLAEHIRTLKGSPAVRRSPYRLSDILMRLSAERTDVENACKVYRAVIDVAPPEAKGDFVLRFATFLHTRRRLAQALEVYNQLLSLAESQAASELPPTSLNQVTIAVGGSAAFPVVTTPLIRWADLAHRLGKSDDLKQRLRAAAKAAPKWKPLCDLMVALLARRAGDERPLAEIGRRCQTDPEFARRFPYETTLREELAACSTRSALEVAVDLWTSSPSAKSPAQLQQRDVVLTATRLAEVYVKLGKREEARQTLLKVVRPDAGTSRAGRPPAMWSSDDRLWVAQALRQHGFWLDAVSVYQRLLHDWAAGRPAVSVYTQREAARSLQECFAKVLGARREATLSSLVTQLRQPSPDLELFFVVQDPLPSNLATSRYAGAVSIGPPPDEVATASAQVLPVLLRHARKSGKLSLVQQLVAKRMAELGDKDSVARRRLEVLHLLTLCCGPAPEKAVPALRQWAERVEKDAAVACEPGTWLLALEALDHPATRPLGRQLAEAVFRAATATRDAPRQQAALAALARAKADVRSLLRHAAAVAKSNPESVFQLALAYYRQGEYDTAVDTLAPLWKQSPEVLLSRVVTVFGFYEKANRLAEFLDALGSVSLHRVSGQSRLALFDVLGTLPGEPQFAPKALQLYRRWHGLLPPTTASGLASRLGRYLARLPADEHTLRFYEQAVFPSEGFAGELGSLAEPLVRLALSTGREAEVRERCRQAEQRFPKWGPRGELLLAMLERRKGNEEPLNQLARRYQSDPSFAAQLDTDRTLLRSELEQCQGRPALELALKLWEVVASQEWSQDVTATVKVAELLHKLGRRDEARRVLLARAARRRTLAAASPDTEVWLKVQLCQRLGGKLAELDFPADALRVYQQALAVDVSQLAADSYARRRLEGVRAEARRLIRKMLETQRDQLLQQLRAALSEKRPGEAVGRFLVVVDPPPTDALAPASSARGPDALLPTLLEHAKTVGALDELKRLVDQAREKRASDLNLLALDVLISLTQGRTEAALSSLERLAPRARRTHRLHEDAVWLATHEALKADPSNATARQLASEIADAAGRGHNLARQEAAAVALAEARAAADRTDTVSDFMRALLLGEPEDSDAKTEEARSLPHQGRGDEATEAERAVREKAPKQP